MWASMNAVVALSNLTCWNQKAREEQKLAARIFSVYMDGKNSLQLCPKEKSSFRWGTEEVGITIN